ncbi:MAG: hypothetical protein EOP56_13820 [Sphingobacteriales bacterium]|nr:MAG: hypothetical protein EOP56_13820 [Sphingobacteriales bacterium]
MTKQRIYLLLAVLVVSLCWVSCKQERPICFVPKDASLKLSTFQATYRDTGLFIGDSSLPNALIYALDTTAKVMVNAGGAQKDFGLYLSKNDDSTRFVILADSLAYGSRFAYDTVTFYYQRKLQFLSVACGYTNFYSLKSVRHTYNNIDSVLIIATEVTNAPNAKHVKVYY